jgi:hypothetical protein
VALGSPSFEQLNELKFKVGTKEKEKKKRQVGFLVLV